MIAFNVMCVTITIIHHIIRNQQKSVKRTTSKYWHFISDVNGFLTRSILVNSQAHTFPKLSIANLPLFPPLLDVNENCPLLSNNSFFLSLTKRSTRR